MTDRRACLILTVLIGAFCFILVYTNGSGAQTEEQPAWVKAFIARHEAEPVTNPPGSLTKCMYQGKAVYYYPGVCCDQFSELYDEAGKGLCAPDGGLAGNGDGKCPDYHDTKTNCEVIWNDPRSAGSVQTREPQGGLLEGKHFESVQDYPRFRGAPMAKNTIEFTGSQWTWSHGDVEEDGTFSLDAQGNMTAIRRVGDEKIIAAYDPLKDVLIWEGEEYRLKDALELK